MNVLAQIRGNRGPALRPLLIYEPRKLEESFLAGSRTEDIPYIPCGEAEGSLEYPGPSLHVIGTETMIPK